MQELQAPLHHKEMENLVVLGLYLHSLLKRKQGGNSFSDTHINILLLSDKITDRQALAKRGTRKAAKPLKAGRLASGFQ